MEVAKVTSKGQITIPISIRRSLEINEGDKVLFIYKPDGVMMVNPNTFQDGASDGDVTEATEVEIVAKSVATEKKREASKAQPKSTTNKSKTSASKPTKTNKKATAQRQVDATVEEVVEAKAEQNNADVANNKANVVKPKRTGVHADSFNLNTLLDDLRSIGSIQ